MFIVYHNKQQKVSNILAVSNIIGIISANIVQSLHIPFNSTVFLRGHLMTPMVLFHCNQIVWEPHHHIKFIWNVLCCSFVSQCWWKMWPVLLGEWRVSCQGILSRSFSHWLTLEVCTSQLELFVTGALNVLLTFHHPQPVCSWLNSAEVGRGDSRMK